MREPGAMARTILSAYMTGRAVAEQIAEKVKVEIDPSLMSTYIERGANVKLPVILFDRSGAGVLKELALKSDTSNYRVITTVDGLEGYSNDWSWFYTNSDIIDEIAAFQKDSIYILSISDIKFSKSLKIAIRPTHPSATAIRLAEVFLKVDIKE